MNFKWITCGTYYDKRAKKFPGTNKKYNKSICAEAKIAPNVLKEILGHSDTAVTMKYYIDIDTDFIESENQNVVDYLIDKNIFEYAK